MLKKLGIFFLLLITAVFVLVFINLDELNRKYIYPIKFEEYVERYSNEAAIDKYLIYAIIKTESGFSQNAESNAGARGLMQLMNETFEWVKFRMGDNSDTNYGDMFSAGTNIKYGTYLFKLLYDEYGDIKTSLAAYHTGRGNVNNWLKDKRYSSDGRMLKTVPSNATAHYIEKVISAYESYRNLYSSPTS